MNYRSLFYLLLAVVTVGRLVYSSLFPLTMDEAYYWSWTRNLSLSYYDHPPVVAYTISLTTWLLGTSEFSVRLGAVLYASGIMALLYWAGILFFKSEKAGFYAALTTAIVPLYSIGAVIITPDTPQAFFWVLAMILLYRAVESGRVLPWLVAGIASGACFLSKYTGFFLIFSLGLYLLFNAERRGRLLTLPPYLGLAAAFGVFSPVIFWNAQYGWSSFGFQLAHGFAQKKGMPGLAGMGDFVGAQVALVSPLLFLGLLGLAAPMWKRGMAGKQGPYLYLFCMSFPIVLFFILLSYKSKVEGNWGNMAYFAAILAAVGIVEEKWEEGLLTVGKKRYVISSLLLALLMTGILYSQALAPAVAIPRLKEIYSRWDMVAEKLEEIKREMKKEGRKGEPFLFSDKYQTTSQLSFYTVGRPATYMVLGDKRYDYKAHPPLLKGKDAIYVSDEPNEYYIHGYFERVESAGEMSITLKGKEINHFWFSKGYGYLGGLIEPPP